MIGTKPKSIVRSDEAEAGVVTEACGKPPPLYAPFESLDGLPDTCFVNCKPAGFVSNTI